MTATAVYHQLQSQLGNEVALVAVSKTKPVADIQALYDLGQRDFGENYVQELISKHQQLPADIRWHFIGHLQTNKVKSIISFVALIQGVDSERLLREISKQAQRAGREVNVLLQMHIAKEETKFGMNEEELNSVMQQYLNAQFPFVKVIGLMGMASFSDNPEIIRNEFNGLSQLFRYWKSKCNDFTVLSMGMSSDYELAIREGSNLVRIGSLLFGERKPIK